MARTYAEVREQFDREIINTILNQPRLRYADIAKLFGISCWTVNATVRKHGLTGKLGRKTGPKPKRQSVVPQGE